MSVRVDNREGSAPAPRAVGASGDARYCGTCGRSLAVGRHVACEAGQLEPPRYCPRCARRMVVQVTPLRWTARCSQHGTLA